MLGLPIDIPHQRRPIDQTHRERRIPTLPSKSRKLRSLRLDPLRRRNLQPLNNPSNRLGPPQKHRHMHMIGNPADPHTNILRTTQHRRQIRMHLHPYWIAKPWPTPRRAEHNMHQHLRDRLAHAAESDAGLQPAPYNFRPPGALPQAKITRAYSPHHRQLRSSAPAIFRAGQLTTDN